MIKNIIFDMGNVLLDYNPQICLDCFLENEKDKALIMEELFRGPEWIEGDLGYLTDEERYVSGEKADSRTAAWRSKKLCNPMDDVYETNRGSKILLRLCKGRRIPPVCVVQCK